MLNLHKLEIFATVVRVGSFSAAAEQLLMTQPAVSQHIQDLEASLGTRLFERGRRGVTLTAAGEKLHDYTRTILQLVSEAENAVTDVEHLTSGEIVVGATPGVSVYLLPEPVQGFQGRYPNLTVQTQTSTTPKIVRNLLQGRLEIGLIEGELGEPIDPVIGVQVLEVVEQLVMVGRKHPWWGKTEIELSGLKGQTFIMRQRSSQTRIWLDDILQLAEVRPKIGAEFDNVESIKRAVMNSTNIAILPAYTLQSEHAQAEFWTIPVGAEPLQRTLKLIWNRETLFSPVVRAFLIYLQRSFPAIDIAKICNH